MLRQFSPLPIPCYWLVEAIGIYPKSTSLLLPLFPRNSTTGEKIEPSLLFLVGEGEKVLFYDSSAARTWTEGAEYVAATDLLVRESKSWVLVSAGTLERAKMLVAYSLSCGCLPCSTKACSLSNTYDHCFTLATLAFHSPVGVIWAPLRHTNGKGSTF